ncbi:MAG: putative manganese-dependent inorganic diphosphatase [Desulfuromonadales bacterium]|nr:putative manganese-dependent inorganic diphosphatase [Desulfuromonadales bacterium]
MSQPERILVIGHRNPDTDSVCSAIAYAELCRLQGRDNVFPGRTGHLNRQTEFVLDTLGQKPPALLTDVYPRLRDTVDDHPAVIDCDAPLMQALELMRQRDIRMLPVIDADRKPLGALVLKRLTEHVFLPREGRPIRQVLSSPSSIQSCLQARAVNLVDETLTEELDLFVGAMSVESFRKHLSGTNPRRIVVFTGDRRDIQQSAIELGVRLLVVTGGLTLEDDLVALASEQEVTILCTPFDTATSALLARMSTPVRYLADADIPRAYLDDRLDEIRKVLMRSTAPGVMVIDDEGRVCGVATKSNLLRPSSLKLILVDHNELSQAVPGADQVDILEVIDHHRLGNFHTDAPIRFINQPLGSTCSVVATLYRQAGIEPEFLVASLLLAGLLSDTVLLKSPTTTEVDRELVGWLEKCSGLEPFVFGRQMFEAGSALAAYPDIEALLTADFKEYEVEARRFGVGQVEVITFQEFDERREEILLGLEGLVRKRNLGLAGLLVTDIVQQNSQFVVRGDKDLIAAIGYPQLESGCFELKGVLSRKKQLMPHLLRAFKGN